MSSLAIRVGGKYKNKQGYVVTIIQYHLNTDWYESFNGCYYHRDGTIVDHSSFLTLLKK